METRVIEHFDKLAGVSGVRVSRNDDSFSIDVDVFTFDKPTRRRIYAKERDLNELFQNFSFDVRLIDLSGTATNNAQHE